MVQKFVPWSRVRIFRNLCTHPPHWTQNSCFIVFYTIFVHLAPFGCVTKHSAKRAQLMKKFVPRSRIGIFRNERTQSTPLDPELTSYSVSYYFGAFGTVRLLQNSVQNGPNWCKSSCHEVASDFFATNATDPPHRTLNSCCGVCCTIWMHLGPFGCLKNSVQNGPKWCKSSCHEVVSEFFATNVGTPLNPKLMFHSVLYYFCAIGSVRLCYKTQCKTGQTDEKVRATKSHRNFSQRTQPIHHIGL